MINKICPAYAGLFVIRKGCQSQSAADCFAVVAVDGFVAVAVVVAPSLLAFAADIAAGFLRAG